MKKGILLIVFVLCIFSCTVFAEKIEKNAIVAVMDFGIHPVAATANTSLINAGMTSSEYIILKLIQDGKFTVMDKDSVREKLDNANLKIVGIIDPDSARKLAEILNIKYLIYGNVNDVTISDTGVESLGSGVTVHTVKAHIIARIMDIESGMIIAAAKGEGKSKSSFTELNTAQFGIMIGNVLVTQESVHNALKKAAFNVVDILTQRVYDK